MATVKNTSGDYIITCDSGIGNLILNANLDVYGNISYVNNLSVDDAFITVAANNTGAVTSMGMIAQKSSNTYAGLRFNSLTSDWEISPSVTSDGTAVSPYVAIGSGSGSSPGGPANSLQFNDSGSFGGSANLSFDNTLNQLILTGSQIYSNIGNAPVPIANSVALYGNTPGHGGTGLYVISPTVNDELISANQAFVYSIIF